VYADRRLSDLGRRVAADAQPVAAQAGAEQRPEAGGLEEHRGDGDETEAD